MRIISRKEWGARYADSYRGYTAKLPKSWGYAHHDTGPSPAPDATLAEDKAAIRAIERVGQQRFGWGISYSFLITRSGRIFAGHRRDGVGTHTHGYNSTTLAICFVGNYEDIEPTEAQLDAAAWLLRHGEDQGWTTDRHLKGGHRDLKATACPGQNVYSVIDDINKRAAQPQEDDMAIHDNDIDRIVTALRETTFNPKGRPSDVRVSLIDAINEIHLATARSNNNALAAAIEAQRPLLEAAADGRALTAEEVQGIADAAAAAVPDGLAADVVNELHERLGEQEKTS